jgi:F-type H+-transporting ATPase subunit delta
LSSQAVARRYATALADVLEGRPEAREVQTELLEWQQMISSNPLLQQMLNNPTIGYEQKHAALNELISRTRVRQTTANILQVLLKNHRLSDLAAINEKLALVLDERAGVVSAQVTSARPLDNSSRTLIEQNLRGITGRNVRVDFVVDEKLIGGIVTKIGSTVYDGSIRNQLEELGKTIAGT